MESNCLRFYIISEKDSNFLFQLINSPKWHQFIGDRNIKNEEHAKEYMASKMSPQLSEKGFVNYVMLDKATNIPVGTCSIHDRESVNGLDVGYALLPQFEGLGYANEGAIKMVRLAFSKYKQT